MSTIKLRTLLCLCAFAFTAIFATQSVRADVRGGGLQSAIERSMPEGLTLAQIRPPPRTRVCRQVCHPGGQRCGYDYRTKSIVCHRVNQCQTMCH